MADEKRAREAGGDPLDRLLGEVFEDLRTNPDSLLDGKGTARAVRGPVAVKSVSRYEIGDELARDSASVLLLARDREVDRDVTLRVLGGEGNGDVTSVRRFLEEAQVGAQLQHPGILPVYGLGLLEDGRAYVASRIVEGETLAELMESGTNAERLLGIVEQAAHALAYAHARGVAHGALDASRIHVGAHGEVVISGWERAVRASWDAHRVEADVHSLLDLLERVLGRSAGGKLDSAGAVARAIGKHLAVREARARKAEVDAARARVLAEEERARVLSAERRARGERAARHRTVAAALAALLIATLGVGAMLWRQGEAEAERRRVEAQVAEALREAGRFEEAGNWAEARAQAKKAAALADGGRRELLQRTQSLLASVEEAARVAREDGELLSRLGEIRLATMLGELEDPAGAYLEAFRAAGLDLLRLGPREVAAALSSRSDPAKLSGEIDRWCTWLARGERERLLAATKLIDPDPWHREMRDAVRDMDRRKVGVLAATADVSRLSPHTLNLVLSVLAGGPSEELRELHLERSVSLCTEFLIRRPGDLVILWWEALLLCRLERYGEAVPLYRRLVESLPSQASRLCQELSGALARVGEWRGALEAANRAVEAAPDDANAHFCAGGALLSLGRRAEAVEAYRRAIDLGGSFLELQSNLGTLLYKLGRAEEAIVVLEGALGLELLGHGLPRRPTVEDGRRARAGVWNDLGNAYFAVGRTDEGMRAYRRAIESSPESDNAGMAHANLGRLLSDSGRLPEAIRHLRRAIELDGSRPDRHFALGQTLFRAGDVPGAVEAYRDCLRLDPDDAAALNALAWIFATAADGELRHPEEAARLAERAVRLAPASMRWAYLNTLGVALYRVGRFEKAIEALEVSIRLAPQTGPHNGLFIAMAHHRLGRHDAAREWFEKSVRWMEASGGGDEELRRFHAEAEALLGAGRTENGK